MKVENLFIIFILCISVTTDCGRKISYISRAGEAQVVDKSHKKRPSWTVKPPEDTEKYYYSVGVRTGAPTLEGGETDARMDAGRKFIERFFGVVASAEYQKLRKSYETKIMDALKGKTKGKIAGARVKEVYWEKVEVKGAEGIRYAYNVWVLLEVNKSETEKVLKEHLEMLQETLTYAKKTLRELESSDKEKSEKDILFSLKNLRKSLLEFKDVPEVFKILMDVEKKIMEVEHKLKSALVCLSEFIDSKPANTHLISAEIMNFLSENKFQIEKVSSIEIKLAIEIAKNRNLNYLIYGTVQTRISGKRGFFIFAETTGNVVLIDVNSKNIILSINLSEKGAGSTEERAITISRTLASKKIKEKLKEKIQELF